MSPAEVSRLAVFGTTLFGGWLCWLGAWAIGLWFIAGAAFVAYHVNHNP